MTIVAYYAANPILRTLAASWRGVRIFPYVPHETVPAALVVRGDNSRPLAITTVSVSVLPCSYLLLLVGVAQSRVGEVQLAWDAPVPSTTVVGYMLYNWPEPGGLAQSVDVRSPTTYRLPGLVDGATYSFAVTAYGTDGQKSDESNIVTVTTPSGPPLISPLPLSTLPGSIVPFAWSSGGASVAEWWLYVGSSVGANDLFDSGSLGSALSTTVSGLPTDGAAMFVRLWYLLEGTWQASDFQQYTAFR